LLYYYYYYYYYYNFQTTTRSVAKLMRGTTANSLFSKTDFCLVFSNIEKLKDLAATFEADLQHALAESGVDDAVVAHMKLGDAETLSIRNSAIRAIQKVAEAFTRFAPYFPAVYSAYTNAYPTSISTLTRLRNKEAFNEFLGKRTNGLKVCNNLQVFTMQSFMIKVLEYSTY